MVCIIHAYLELYFSQNCVKQASLLRHYSFYDVIFLRSRQLNPSLPRNF